MKKKIIYYKTYEDDLVTSKNQDYHLKDNYKWYHTNIFYKIISYLVYYLVLLISLIYSRLILRIKVIGTEKLRTKSSYFMYSNHTLTLGDVLNPFIINFPKKPYLICSSSNLGIPVIGKIIPIAGGIPIPTEINKMIKMNKALNDLSKKNPIIIYPEAHLWPYYTKIRPFNNSPFYYPIDNDLPVFISTTTYQKRKFFKKPKITIYIDGPFTKDPNLSRKENIKKIHDTTFDIMNKRSQNSTYEYIKYKKK